MVNCTFAPNTITSSTWPYYQYFYYPALISLLLLRSLTTSTSITQPYFLSFFLYFIQNNQYNDLLIEYRPYSSHTLTILPNGYNIKRLVVTGDSTDISCRDTYKSGAGTCLPPIWIWYKSWSCYNSRREVEGDYL